MSREWRFYLDDMIACCERVSSYVAGLDRTSFDKGGMAYDAIVRNVELLGEAARHVPEDVRKGATGIDWRAVVAVRNILVHGYFSIDNDILWDVIQRKIPEMRDALARLKSGNP